MLATTPATIVSDAILTQFLADDPENADRIYRARDLVQAGHVERSNFPGLWLVRSATTPNGSYRVTNGICNCPDAARVGGQNCKHAVGCRIFRASERADAETHDPTLTVRVDPEDSIIDLWPHGEPCEIPPPVAVGTITRVPYTPEQQVFADELGMA